MSTESSFIASPRCFPFNRASHIALLLALAWLALLGAAGGRSYAVGDPIPRITCPAGYQATLYAAGLSSPDGLAFGPSGRLYVAEERAGRVSRIEADGGVTPVLRGLDEPEGIAFDGGGNLYVVEDVRAGRVVKLAPDGQTTTLATGRDAPEGIVWAPNGNLYISESNVEFASSPFDYRTRITAIGPQGAATNRRTDSPLWSYSGLTLGPDGLLYVANEAAGTGTNEGIFTVSLATGARAVFAIDLVAPEGLRFSAGGQFPLYVVEENDGASRLSQVAANGSHTLLCTGFSSVEDVAVDGAGRLYISEDGSGSIILITPTPANTPTSTPPAGPTPAPLLLPAVLKLP